MICKKSMSKNKQNFNKKIKNEKGSITLFTLISMIFFLTIAFTAYASAMTKLQAQNAELDSIKASYEKEINTETLATLYNEATGTRKWLQGQGTEVNPYKIYTIEDLVELSNTTNNETNPHSYEGEFVELMNDLDFNDVRSYEKYNRTDFWDINGNGTVEELRTELTTGAGFMPIGKDPELVFKGTFDGNNNKIKHLYIDSSKTTEGHGLFGHSYTVKNLTVKDGKVKGNTNTGGIVGICWSGKIENCHNDNTECVLKEVACYTLGGIVGLLQGTGGGDCQGAYNCSNSGTITGLGDNRGDGTGYSIVGGVIGWNASTVIENCNNTGAVTGNGSYAGGIVAYASTNSTITNCNNTGAVTGSGNYVGGVTGCAKSITSCNNTGVVTGSGNYVGGVAGVVNPYGLVSSCSNLGSVTAQGSYIGGVVGLLSHSGNVTNSKVEKCYNSGDVISNGNMVGGIIGLLGGSEGKGIAIKCYNKGKITGKNRVYEVFAQTCKTGLNTLGQLFYLNNSNGLTAIEGQQDSVNDKINSVPDDLTYDQFKTWIESQ